MEILSDNRMAETSQNLSMTVSIMGKGIILKVESNVINGKPEERKIICCQQGDCF
jgi:hypothetical protein